MLAVWRNLYWVYSHHCPSIDWMYMSALYIVKEDFCLICLKKWKSMKLIYTKSYGLC